MPPGYGGIGYPNQMGGGAMRPKRPKIQPLPMSALLPQQQLPPDPGEGGIIGGNTLPPLPGGGPPNFQGYGLPKKPKKAQKLLQGLHLYNAFQAQPQLWSQIGTLTDQANTSQFSPEQRSAFLSPRLEALDEGMALAGGALDRNLSDRGLDSSSEAVSRFANLGARGAAAGADIRNQLFNSEEARQRAAQAELRAILSGLMGQGAQGAAGIAGQRIQQQLQQQQLDAMQGGLLESLLGFAGTAGGAYLGGGFGGIGGGGGGVAPLGGALQGGMSGLTLEDLRALGLA